MEEALAIFGRTLPAESPAIATGLNSLGVIQLNSRDYAAARKNLAAALRIRRRALPKDHPDIAVSLFSLGLLQDKLHDFPSARTSFEEALAIRRKALPKNDLEIAGDLFSLANVQRELNEPAAAEKSFQEALTILRKVLPEENPAVASCLTGLGLVQRDLKDFPSALRSEQQALAIHRKVLPKNHPDIGMSLNNLGWVQMALGDYAAARKSLVEASSIFRKIEHANDPFLAIALENLAATDILAGADVGADIPLLYEAIEECHRVQLRMALNQAEPEQLATAVTSHLSLSALLNAAIAAKADVAPVYDWAVRVKGGVTAQQRLARKSATAPIRRQSSCSTACGRSTGRFWTCPSRTRRPASGLLPKLQIPESRRSRPSGPISSASSMRAAPSIEGSRPIAARTAVRSGRCSRTKRP